jgi:CubicO group peptidase (beta-lactamase class C family)
MTDMTLDHESLQAKVTEAAEAIEVPGLAVGVYLEGTERYAFHGVTSLEHPLPVDEQTIVQIGSTGKTFTATALMRLVERGTVDLDATVRTYVPELRLKDEDVAREVTVLHLLNHTAGWDGDFFEDTGSGDDALARYVERMADLEQVTPLGAVPSYNNAAVCLAGHVIERVTGHPYEHAIKELVFEPVGLEQSFFFPSEVMTRRFTVGHEEGPDGSLAVVRPWAEPRSASPAGGSIACTAPDQIKWARFHMGDGRAAEGTRVLSEELLKRMQEPTVDAGGAIGDHVGISWILRGIDGVRLVQHGGDGAGHHSEFVMVPERDFAITTLANGPGGVELGQNLVRWALEAYVGVVERDPEPVARPAAELASYTGLYETIAVFFDITVNGGGLVLEGKVKPELAAQMMAQGERPPEMPPFPLSFLSADGDRFFVTDGPLKGEKGYFHRDPTGAVQGVHFGGRYATRSGLTSSVADPEGD